MRTRIPMAMDLKPGVSDYVVFDVTPVRMEVALAPAIAEKIQRLINDELRRDACRVSVRVRVP